MGKAITQRDAARSIDINASMLGRWVREHRTNDYHAFRSNGKLTPEQKEIRKLNAQLKQLELEKRTLKETTFGSIGQRSLFPEMFIFPSQTLHLMLIFFLWANT